MTTNAPLLDEHSSRIQELAQRTEEAYMNPPDRSKPKFDTLQDAQQYLECWTETSKLASEWLSFVPNDGRAKAILYDANKRLSRIKKEMELVHGELILTLTPKIRLILRYVPSGEFLMGASNSIHYQAGHKVFVPDYFIGVDLIRRWDFAAFVSATNYRTTAEKLVT